jgi:Domain of unknown function (DUF4384)
VANIVVSMARAKQPATGWLAAGWLRQRFARLRRRTVTAAVLALAALALTGPPLPWLTLAGPTMAQTNTPAPQSAATDPSATQSPTSNPSSNSATDATSADAATAPLAAAPLASAPSVPAPPAAPTVAGAAPGADNAPAITPLYPEPPATALAAKAYATLDMHCARCHQSGKLKIARAARPTANILALDELAGDPALVRPGVPDASPLYTIMLRRHSPLLGPEVWPPIGEDMTASDVQAVRDWIQDLPAFKPGVCPGRPPITAAASAAALEGAIAALPDDKAKSARFISLTNLYNACSTYPELNAYREAVTRVINSLSWKPEAVRLDAVDPERTLLKFDLTDVGWVDAHWEKLVQAYPHGATGTNTAKASEDTVRRTGSAVPMVRGDWFAAAAMTPPLYHSLLGLPARFANLQRILNADRDANIKNSTARRAAIAESTITRAGRITERHPTKSGSLWISYDFGASDGRQNVANHPLGPGTLPAGRVAFKHDIARALFTLPNGFIGFSLNDPTGDRLDRSPPQIDRDMIGWGPGSDNGLACAGCHTNGPLNVRDEVRAAAEADKVMAKDIRDTILALYPPEAEFQTLVTDDHQRHRKALQTAGLNPDLTVHGLDPMTALARQYQKAGGMSTLIADTGLTEDEIARRLADAPDPLKPTVRRLKQAAVSRAELNRLAAFAGRSSGTDAMAQTPADPATAVPRQLELQMWSTQDRYKAGELAAFFVTSNIDCNLTMISVDSAGRGTVLFPNEFEQNNLLPAGRALRVPSETAPFQLRLKSPGRETVVGICNLLAKTADGIQHDYERQRFTILGDWRTFLGQLSMEEGADQKADRSTEARLRARQNPRAARQRGAAPAPPAQVPTGEALAPPVEMQARTAVTVEVE